MGDRDKANRPDEREQPAGTGAQTGRRGQETADRIGPYGGDDGALEHERTETEEPEMLTSEDTISKEAPGRKPGR